MGKTTVADMFARRGVLLIDTDVVARQLVEPGQPALDEIVAQFGMGVVDSVGNLRRDVLAAIVFKDKSARAKLEAILHPRITEFWQTTVAEWERRGARVGMVVIPLLFETGAESCFHTTICVACGSTSQNARMFARGWSPEERRQRVSAQLPIERKIELSDYVVWAEGPLDVTDAQVDRILKRILA